MPGFWEYLQQFSDRDNQNRESLTQRQMALTQMMGQSAQNDATNALNYAQMQSSGLASQGGLLQGIAGLQQGDRRLVSEEQQNALQRAAALQANREQNATSTRNAQISAAGNASDKKFELLKFLAQMGWTVGANGEITELQPTGEPGTLAKPVMKAVDWFNQRSSTANRVTDNSDYIREEVAKLQERAINSPTTQGSLPDIWARGLLNKALRGK